LEVTTLPECPGVHQSENDARWRKELTEHWRADTPEVIRKVLDKSSAKHLLAEVSSAMSNIAS